MDNNPAPTQGESPVSQPTQMPPPGPTPMPEVPKPESAPVSTPPAEPPTPPVAKKSNLVLWITLGFLLIAAVALGAYFLGTGSLFGLGQSEATPTPTAIPSPSPTPDEMADWKTFSDKAGLYTFQYPPEVEVKEEADGSLVASQWGPTQKAETEFFDGISLSFKTSGLGGKNLKAFVDQKVSELSGVFETTTPTQVSLAGKVAYKFHVKGNVEADYYYVEIEQGTYLEVIDATKDPTNVGFAETVSKILSSLKAL